MHEGLLELHGLNVKNKYIKHCRARYYQIYVVIVFQYQLAVTNASVKEAKIDLWIP